MSDLLVARGLEKRFTLNQQTVTVLQHVDVTVAAGELVAVVGASGTGKSTLLNVLGTLDTPSAGSVRFDGQDLLTMAEGRQGRFRNRELGFVFQFNQLLPEFSALENAAMPLLMRGERRARERARELLTQVGLADRLDHRPGELSGGEQQRVAIARALVSRPRLVLADEPTGNLDSHSGEAVFTLLESLAADAGSAILMVTHNEQLAARCGRILTMVDGRLNG